MKGVIERLLLITAGSLAALARLAALEPESLRFLVLNTNVFSMIVKCVLGPCMSETALKGTAGGNFLAGDLVNSFNRLESFGSKYSTI